MHVPNKYISLLIFPTPLEIETSLALAKIRLDQLRIIHIKHQLRWTIRRQHNHWPKPWTQYIPTHSNSLRERKIGWESNSNDQGSTGSNEGKLTICPTEITADRSCKRNSDNLQHVTYSQYKLIYFRCINRPYPPMPLGLLVSFIILDKKTKPWKLK